MLKANILVLYADLHLVLCVFSLTTAPGCTWEAGTIEYAVYIVILIFRDSKNCLTLYPQRPVLSCL